jgi:hypothetical protein
VRVVPKRVATALALVAALGPLLGGAGTKETVTFCCGINPLGKPDPITFISCTSGCPALGAAAALSFTCALAGAMARNKTKANASNQRYASLEFASRICWIEEFVIAVFWLAVPARLKLEKHTLEILGLLIAAIKSATLPCPPPIGR